LDFHLRLAWPHLEVGFAAHLFFARIEEMSDIQTDIETRLRSAEPEVEVLLAEEIAAERVRVFVDHPAGVDLALCERVTAHLRDLLVDYSLEVSSPGPERPLSKPEHYRRYLGRRARVRTRETHEGRRSYTGELVGATDEAVTIAADGGVVTIPYADVKRSNLLEG
jgi:ribosome maturation factor RimP